MTHTHIRVLVPPAITPPPGARWAAAVAVWLYRAARTSPWRAATWSS